MHSSSSAELQSLQICQDDKFLSKLLSRERSITGSSGRAAYYTGISGSVPFTWETQPGTPRTVTVSCNKQLETPPLMPPPAYYYTTDTDDQAAGRRISSSRSRLLKTLFSHSKDAGSWDNAAVQRTSSTESVSSYSSSFSGKRESGRISSSCSGSMSSSIIFDEIKKVDDVLDHAIIMEKLVLTRESSPTTYVTCFGMKKIIRSQGRKGAVAPETKFAVKRGFWSRLCVI